MIVPGINYENVLNASREKGISVPETLEKLKLCGYAYLDIKYERLIESPALYSVVLSSGMKIRSLFTSDGFLLKNNYGKELGLLEYAKDKKIPNVMLLYDDCADGDEKTQLFYLKQNLRHVVNYGAILNVSVSVENFGKGYFSTVESLKNILSSVKGLGLTFDCGNFILADVDPLAAYDELKEYVSRIHLKDRAYKIRGNEPITETISGKKTCVFPLGEGDSRIAEIIKLAGDKVDYCVESDFKGSDNFDVAVKSANYLYTEICK